MLGPEEIRRQAERRYRDYLSSLVAGSDPFPVEIRFAKVKPGEISRRYGELRSELAALREGSDEGGRPSYRIEWEDRSDRLAGKQTYPARVRFPDAASLLGFLEKTGEEARFRTDLSAVLDTFPALRGWAEGHPERIVAHAGEWEGILAVLRWLLEHPRPGVFVREVPVVEDTKFIERNRGILRELLDMLLPPAAVDASGRNFEERFGLLRSAPLVRVRFLDQGIGARRFSGVADLSVPAGSLDRLNFPELRTLIVVENKASFSNLDVFLTLPRMTGAAAVFGSGFAAASLAACAWMAERRILYWGDIDTHGLRILARFRAAFGGTRSVLMDEPTFDRYPAFRADAPQDLGGPPDGLTEAEAALFSRLASLPARNRLEQERIPVAWASRRIADALDEGSLPHQGIPR